MREEIIDLIREGKTEEALNLGLSYFSKSDGKNNDSLTLLLNQFNTLKRRRSLGLGENIQENNRIVKALIEIVNKSDKKDYDADRILSEIDTKRKQEEEKQVKLRLDEIHTFCKGVEGFWLSYGSDAGLVGFISFKIDKARITVQEKGEAYNAQGELIYQWNSIASSVDVENEKVNYIWEGHVYEKLPGTNIRRAKEPKNKGWGELSFRNKKNARYEYAMGRFYDTELQNWNEAKSTVFKRCGAEEMETVYTGERSQIAELVKKTPERVKHICRAQQYDNSHTLQHWVLRSVRSK